MSFEDDYGVSLKEAAEGLDDELQVIDERGVVIACVGLLATFILVDGHTPEVRGRVVDAFECFHQAVGDVFRWGGDPKTGKARKLTGKGAEILDVRSWMPRIRSYRDFEPIVQSGVGSGDAGAYSFCGATTGEVPGKRYLSSVEVTLPFAWASERPEGAFLRLVHQLCELLRPEHGSAGLGIILPIARGHGGSGMAPAKALAARFRGLDLSAPPTLFLEKEDAIKGVNWLTILGDAWVERAGGLDALRESLGKAITIHTYHGGILIQAGPHPRLGDVQRAEPMTEYETVAKALVRIRAKQLGAPAPFYGWDLEFMTKWLARFDRPLGHYQ